ncbi:protein phosphatase regulator REG1 [Saccharomyces paradoxus]|uniref:Protein phosphatase regulator REG1 n=1 Tax=Saccharomyces paradoxus TaxID=27291 RepID=A0A8B8UNE2_SACPA|nr:Reg1 [Saccharomyces paradoxus]QHS72250.1 Reg1 [Saccharomyces paradoxus]
MSTNLANYFAGKKDTKNEHVNRNASHESNSKSDVKVAGNDNDNDDEDMGPSVSMAVQAKNDDDFHKSTFNLKRTRSMGLLDEYIDPTKKLLGRPDDLYGNDNEYYDNSSDNSSSNSSDDDYDDDYQEHSTSVSPPPADNDSYLMPQDDNDVVVEPERHVDYLSHEWKESEISNSWKYIILKKKKRDVDLVNAARLENASWRTWAKARNNLKTVSPEVVNWSKDSDVTWLYGPIIRDSENNAQSEEEHDLERGYGSDDENSKRISMPTKKSKSLTAAPKPILKKRTVTEIIEDNALWKLNEARKHMTEMKHASVIMDPNGNKNVHDDFDALAAQVNAQYYHYPKNSNSSVSLNGQSSDKKDNYTIPNSLGVNPNVGNDEGKEDLHLKSALRVQNNPSTAQSDKSILENNTNDRVKSHLDENLDSSDTNRFLSSKSCSNKDNENHSIGLSSILTSSPSEKSNKPTKNRHIHFNDRVEQCMALRYPASQSEDDESDGENRQYVDVNNNANVTTINNNRTPLLATQHKSIPVNSAPERFNKDTSDDDTSSPSSSSSHSDDEEHGGLYINARFSRRSDSGVHSPITDNSSVASSTTSRAHVRPIIKLLPDTTLNYGSDEESDNGEFNGYGNAVSHNVNTSRGYDYIYDYNSVYTGDTSSFLPVDSCDIVDVPEGMDLQTAIADDNASNYEFNNAVESKEKHSPQLQKASTNNTTRQHGSHMLLYDDDNYSSSSDSEQQFIEDSQYNSSDDEEEEDDDDDQAVDDNHDEGLSLRRTLSLGKSGSTNSLCDLAQPSLSSATLSQQKIPTNFIAGKTDESKDAQLAVRPYPLKRNSSSGNFIFNSDSEEESSSEDEQRPIPAGNKLVNRGSLKGSVAPANIPSQKKTALPKQPKASDSSQSFRIVNKTPSPAEVGSSDVAIEGYFSPRNESIKSVVSGGSMMDHQDHSEMETLAKGFENCHINNTGRLKDKKADSLQTTRKEASLTNSSNESLQKVMQNAKGMASKYLHSWKRSDVKPQENGNDSS